MTIYIGDWVRIAGTGEPGRVVDRQDLWGTITYQVWCPAHAIVVRVPSDQLATVPEKDPAAEAQRLTYAAAAARIADALERDTLVAPLEGTVIPLPHQLYALSRAISGDRVRYLLADEVGLGKTIEAGLIMRELKIRGLVRRTLVVAPTGLVTQWVQEMKTHFNEPFRLVIPSDFSAFRHLVGLEENDNLWRLHEQVVCPLDSVKPMETRRGWSYDQVAQYNRERFDDLVSCGWDLVIFDEAHRLGGSSEQVARYKLAEAMSQAVPYLLLLTATPHQGKTDAFRRLMAFLDPQEFPDDQSIVQERVAPYVIRTEKRRAIDADGNPLFKARRTQLVAVRWADEQEEQRALYEGVTEYVRNGYNRAIAARQTAVGFLMLLMQRLVTSSTRAIRTALERRLDVLQLPDEQLSLFPEDIAESWATLDGQEQMDAVLKARLKGLTTERAEVELLLSAARRCEARTPDVKAQELLDRIYALQREENDPELKALVFTEFVPTQEMLAEFLRSRGFSVACLNGSMGLDQRRSVQRAFAGEARVLISTDAGGEGLNLQFAHVVVNYDLPWNPMKIEQRIGRVDRIGQTRTVRAFNFALEDTVELRVREVLEEKLQRILEEFGVDKLSDVLDSEEGDVNFEDLYVRSILAPDAAMKELDAFAEELRRRARAAREGAKVLGGVEQFDVALAQSVAKHQLPFWTERMTLAFLRSQGDGKAVSSDTIGYRIRWPDGEELRHVVFSREDSESSEANHLSLEDPHVRDLVSHLPFATPVQPIPVVELPGISDKVSGIWSLWRIAIQAADRSIERILPLFVSEDGRVLGPTARAIWDRLIQAEDGTLRLQPDAISGSDAEHTYARCAQYAEEHGRGLHQEILAAHRDRLGRERRKASHAFDARRRAIERIGLPQVRNHRLTQLETERQAWEAQMAERETAVSELSAVILLRVAPQRHSA